MSFNGYAFQISSAYYPRQVITIGSNNVNITSSPNANENIQKWTFWRVYSDDSYVIRNYTTGRFLGLLYHGKVAGVEEGAAIHWDIQPSGYDASTWVIRMKNDTLNRVMTFTKASGGDVILDFADARLSGFQEWRLRETEYHVPDDFYMPELTIDGDFD